MAVTVTINDLKNSYLNYLQSQNSKINAFAPNTFWSIDAGAMSASLLDLYGNLKLLENSIYPQNAVGDQVDLWLYSRGLPARGGLTYATVQCVVSSITPVTIPKNTIFTDSVTGNQYQALSILNAEDDTTVLNLYSVQPGNTYYETPGSILISGDYNLVVISSVNGQLEESDQSCINRILQSIRSPVSGARETDYQVYALESNTLLPAPVITDSIPVPSFITVGNVGILGIFDVIGTPITEYQLNQGLLSDTTFIPYSREAGSDVVATTNNYIQSLRLVGLTVVVGTCITQKVTTSIDTFNINVSLIPEYTLSTLLTIPSEDNNNNPITVQLTVEQIIQREIRRAICNQNYGATNINDQNYITIDSIIYALNLQLSAINGQLVQILNDITISNSNIEVPNSNYNNSNVYYQYDITEYSDIVVTNV